MSPDARSVGPAQMHQGLNGLAGQETPGQRIPASTATEADGATPGSRQVLADSERGPRDLGTAGGSANAQRNTRISVGGPSSPLGVGGLLVGGTPFQGEWTDSEIATYLRRVAALSKGMSEVDAERLAEQMLYRDRPESGDDRRICLECTSFRKGRCQRGAAVVMVLQRCDGFQLRGAA